MQTLLPDWGIYTGVNDARTFLSRFADHVVGPDVGIVWLSRGAMYPLRAPRRDGTGFGDVLVIDFALDLINHLAPTRWTERLESFFTNALSEIGQAQVEQAEANAAMVASIRSMMTEKRMDGLGVVLDVICVVASIGAVMTGVGVIGLIAFGGGIVLLAADGAAFGAEVADNNALAEIIKKKTEILRVAAMVASLPDLAYGGVKLLKEMGEVRELKLADDLSSSAATSLQKRTMDASRASEYAQIAEKARLRSQIRSEQLMGLWKHEMTPRATVPPALMLLLKEEYGSENDSVTSRFLKSLSFHVISVHS
ncbi:MAG: hypothetical protein ACRYG8_06610 [Janthinobacterium lividum]